MNLSFEKYVCTCIEIFSFLFLEIELLKNPLVILTLKHAVISKEKKKKNSATLISFFYKNFRGFETLLKILQSLHNISGSWHLERDLISENLCTLRWR